MLFTALGPVPSNPAPKIRRRQVLHCFTSSFAVLSGLGSPIVSAGTAVGFALGQRYRPFECVTRLNGTMRALQHLGERRK